MDTGTVREGSGLDGGNAVAEALGRLCDIAALRQPDDPLLVRFLPPYYSELPADDVDRLIGTGLGHPLAKPGQRPMREWVLLPFDGAAARRVDRAYAFVSGQG